MTDRRRFLFGATGALLWNQGAPAAGAPDLSAPADALRALIHLQARLDGVDTPWWYFGRIFGVMPGEQPRLLFRFEGVEIPRFTRIAPDEYAVNGVTTTFFQDPATHQVLENFTNPYTGEQNTVAPNLIGGPDTKAFAFYSPGGIRFSRTAPLPAASDSLRLDWEYQGDTAYLTNERQYPPGVPSPIMESSCTRARIADLRDTRRAWIPAAFSSTYVNQWPRWMNMQGRPGHVVWHSDGLKFRTASDLPAEFLRRMRAQFPDRLSAPPYRA